MKTLARRFAEAEDGGAVIEYGLIVALLTVAITGGIRFLGSSVWERLMEATRF